ncbi:MAG: AglZ/HisF2 family acetamidino modification protein [Mycobacteriales bacterium]
MNVPRVIPCLLTDGHSLVKTRQFADPTYVGDPVNVLSIFSELEVDEIFLLDIGATRDGRAPNLDLVARVAEECIVPLAYGGGITTPEQVARILDLGVEKVVVNSGWVDDPSLVQRSAERHGSQAVVVSIDARRTPQGHRVATASGTIRHDVTPRDIARRAVALGAGELLVTSIDEDGMRSGYDLDLIASVSAAVDVPVVACGGAGRREDLATAVREGGATAAAAGSIFVFYGVHRAVLINFPSRAQVGRLLAAASIT